MEDPSIHNIRVRRRLNNGIIHDTRLQLTVDPSSCPLTTDTQMNTEYIGDQVAASENETPFHDELRKYVETDRTITLRQTCDTLLGYFEIQNISGLPVIFKIRTTNARDFGVSPVIGLLEANQKGKIMVIGRRGITEAALERARFQVAALPVPNDDIQEDYSGTEELNFLDLNREWKSYESRIAPQLEELNVDLEVLTPETDQEITCPCEENQPCDEDEYSPWLIKVLLILVLLAVGIMIYWNLTEQPAELPHIEVPPPPTCFGAPV